MVVEKSRGKLSGPGHDRDYAASLHSWESAPTSRFSRSISISLGSAQPAPDPLLEEGHLLYYVVEIFKAARFPNHADGTGKRVGLTLLLFLMAFAIYNDSTVC